ncbi:hypothetical protein FGRMN_8552 [Fusarium graminum]|nr:hypothetical protein FGRMN_8552 [Fusarium graminum]
MSNPGATDQENLAAEYNANISLFKLSLHLASLVDGLENNAVFKKYDFGVAESIKAMKKEKSWAIMEQLQDIPYQAANTEYYMNDMIEFRKNLKNLIGDKETMQSVVKALEKMQGEVCQMAETLEEYAARLEAVRINARWDGTFEELRGVIEQVQEHMEKLRSIIERMKGHRKDREDVVEFWTKLIDVHKIASQ